MQIKLHVIVFIRQLLWLHIVPNNSNNIITIAIMIVKKNTDDKKWREKNYKYKST